jgi:hypothetical protein
MAEALTFASMQHDWHAQDVEAVASGQLQDPIPDHLSSSKQVTGFSTFTLPDGILLRVFLPDEGRGEVMTMFLPPRLVVELAVAISQSGERAQWWTPECELIPALESQN